MNRTIEAKPEFKNVLNEAKAITKVFSRKEVRTELIKQQLLLANNFTVLAKIAANPNFDVSPYIKKLKKYNKTRWTSLIDAVGRIIELLPAMKVTVAEGLELNLNSLLET